MKFGRRRRFEEALIGCAVALLRDDESSVADALRALLTATRASAVFVERNVEDPRLGLCTSLVEEVLAPGVDPDPEGVWERVPWSRMPMAYEHLSQGRAFAFRPTDLPPPERALYDQTEIRSEIDIPIFVGGRWMGLIGFTDVSHESRWTSREQSLLRTAAELIGRHWETVDGRRRLGELVSVLDRQLRYQSVLAESSRRLLSGGGEGEIDAVLQALLDATGSDYVYVDRNYHDPDDGLCCEIVHEAVRDESVAFGETHWTGGSYRDLPTTYDRLSRGLPCFLLTRELEGAERELYEADGIRSELNVPIMVEGRWEGSVAFASYTREQHWDHVEIDFVRTAAEMIGAHWARVEQTERLADMVVRLEGRHRLEQALTTAAKALLNDDPAALDVTVGTLLDAVGVDFVYVDENFDDPEAGLSCRIVAWAANDPALGEGGWWSGPYAELPTVCRVLEKGEASIVYTSRLRGREREIYEEDGVVAELSLPIRVEGRWQGSLGLDDYHRERRWTAEDIEILGAAAEMIGAYWSRRESRERLEQLVSSKDRFLATVGHELRTPLTSVLGFAEILAGEGDRLSEGDRREMLELIVRESRDAAWIIEDLLAFARADLGRLHVAPATVSLLEQAEAVLRSLPPGRQVGLRGQDEEAWADGSRVRQIIRNLVTNARKYGGDRVEVEVGRGADGPAVRVRDDGPGVPAELREAIFEPYFRAHDERGQPGSMGLGLSVSRQLARLQGGDLRYVRRDGWSVFELTLPAPPGPSSEAVPAAGAAGIGLPGGGSTPGAGEVLVGVEVEGEGVVG